MRLTPRVAGMAAVALMAVFAVTAVTVLPTLSDASLGRDAIRPSDPQVATGALVESMWLAQLPAYTPTQPTPAPATATPDPTPTPAPATVTPTATPKPAAKPKPKPKPVVYANTVAGARAYVRSRIGTRQYNCINVIFTGESKWNPRAGRLAGAYGIPQAFPGSKMAAFGSNWRTSPLTQVKWGIWYVNDRYGSACAALAFWRAHGWY